ncbi:hypothetical protein [Roseimaritima sediminicola]|uniref:hypothetical protein n=1 Tax=Roseimaritima sediminicola TaxID=2662066 RepID=UPI0012984D22|nr:hypothetical protein [Roseimaritima sediminicola]
MTWQRIVLSISLGTFLSAAAAESPQTRTDQAAARAKLRPLGTPGLVDALRQSAAVPAGYQRPEQSASKPVIRQTAMMQASGPMGLPPGAAATPPDAGPAAAPPTMTPPPGAATPLGGSPAAPSTRPVAPPLAGENLQPVPLDNRQLPSPPAALPGGALPGGALPGGDRSPPAADLTPVPQPGLEASMATVDNCACVSAPSSYNAGGLWQCGPEYVVPCSATVPATVPATTPYIAPPAVVAPPVAMPAVATTAVVPTAGCRPLFTLGQDPTNVQIGQGIIGQPKAYVPGQNVRNFIRYFTP